MAIVWKVWSMMGQHGHGLLLVVYDWLEKGLEKDMGWDLGKWEDYLNSYGIFQGTCHQIHVNSGVCDLMYILDNGALC